MIIEKRSISYLVDLCMSIPDSRGSYGLLKSVRYYCNHGAKKPGRVKYGRYPGDIMDSNVNIGNIRQSYDRVSKSHEDELFLEPSSVGHYAISYTLLYSKVPDYRRRRSPVRRRHRLIRLPDPP